MNDFNNKLGFFLCGIINNTSFVLILSCAYSLSMNQEYVNPALILIFNILPGFFTQLAYPYILYNINVKYKFLFLLVTHTISSLLFIFVNNIYILFIAISLISINSYFGELVFLSLTSQYNNNSVKMWSIGTGSAGIIGSGLYLALNTILSNQIIFVINYILYNLVLIIGLKLLGTTFFIQTNQSDPAQLEPKQPEPKQPEPKQPDPTIETIIELEEFNNNIEIGLSTMALENNNLVKLKIVTELFINSYPIWLAFFFGYLINQSLMPLLVLDNEWYTYLQFSAQSGKFIGRTVGNYIHIRGIKKFGLVHIYSFIVSVIYIKTILSHGHINGFILIILDLICSLINGLIYPIVYHNIYEKYKENKIWPLNRAMGSIGQFTTFFTILSSIIGYVLKLIIY